MNNAGKRSAADVGPTLAVPDAIAIGMLLAQYLVDDKDGEFAWRYLDIVKAYYRDSNDHLEDYVKLINIVLAGNGRDPLPASFNVNDFANVHRSAWLKLVRSIVRLVDLNPFAPGSVSPNPPNPWGDPLPGTTSTHSIELPTAFAGTLFFGIPNATGDYSITGAQMDPFDGGPLDS